MKTDIEGRAKNTKISVSEAGEDRISELPDPLAAAILSLLPTKDAVRTSVLSKRWENMWRLTSTLSFDQRSMSRDKIERYLAAREIARQHGKAMKFAWPGRAGRGWDPISAAAWLIERVIVGHSDGLTSCRIQHMIESIREAERLVKKLLLEKKVRELSMECDDPEAYNYDVDRLWRLDNLKLKLPFDILAGYYVIELNNYHLRTSPPPPFEYPQNLKTIKLTHITMEEDVITFLSECLSLENITLKGCKVGRKVRIHNPSVKVLNLVGVNMSIIEVSAMNLEVMVLDTVVCIPKSVVIVAPNLKVLHCYCRKSIAGSDMELYLLFLRQILGDLCGYVTLEGSKYPGVFENLVSLHTNLNLRNVKDALLLSLVLKSCHSLQNLEIKNEVDEKFYALEDNETNKPNLPYPTYMLWSMMEICVCVSEKLRRVHIKGFKGKELEVEFVKYLITMSTRMENITISFDDECAWQDATATLCLLSYPKNSANLSITLEPGKDYVASVGGSFQKWISTLQG